LSRNNEMSHPSPDDYYFTLKQIDSKSPTALAKVIASIMSLYRGEGFSATYWRQPLGHMVRSY
jgi:hypothetical protein